ncbi:hypothetical protein F3Y22_tig00116954pilonHSYRG00251 [Hibiscus syriacus]|uniref:Uncharacterized protein n=1 Tax=Hibiscus syriacus TaxID=106335 RepID=A0A6A2WXW1_HIBSY|nr:hypothetical protein F3Y22_tig00116954pilonHSYRG00251 [Hibiscus syriacus]
MKRKSHGVGILKTSRPCSTTGLPQRYVINSKYNASSPIMVYFGAEEALDYDLSGIGFLTDNAPAWALLVYIEPLPPQLLSYLHDLAPPVGYHAIVTEDFKETTESCYQTIRKSWHEFDEVASNSNGLSIHSMRFKTCEKLKTSFDLKDFLDSVYSDTAQYDHLPTYPSILCSGIDSAPQRTDIEMMMPIGHGNNDSMFPPEPFDLNGFIKKCETLFGVQPWAHWVTTHYGGHDLINAGNEKRSTVVDGETENGS